MSDLAVWPIKTGKWEPPSDLVLRRCKQDFARALREQHILDERGLLIRAKHATRISGGERQQTFWGDIRKAPREHLILAFQQRREQIVGDCRQLDRDVEYSTKHDPKWGRSSKWSSTSATILKRESFHRNMLSIKRINSDSASSQSSTCEPALTATFPT